MYAVISILTVSKKHRHTCATYKDDSVFQVIKRIKLYQATIIPSYRQQKLGSTECCSATSSGTMNGAGPLVQLTTRPLWAAQE